MDIDYTRYGYIYRITNMVNNKTYIGQHKIKPKEKFLDYMGSGRIIRQAIHKYGKEKFSKEILEYAKNKEELSNLEKMYIHEELLNNKSEYNIEYSSSSLKLKFKELLIDDDDLLSWYFDRNMSYKDIALKLGCSEPSIYNYMKKLREIDERFKNIKHGDNRGKKSGFTPEERAKAVKSSKLKVKCENCGHPISKINYPKHYNVCIDENFTYVDGVKKKKCPVDNCDTLIYTKNKTCKEHHIKNLKKSTLDGMNSIKNYESCKLGAISANHVRWHVKRDIVNPNCPLCNPLD